MGELPLPLKRPLLRKLTGGRVVWPDGATASAAALCTVHLLLSMSGPILLDWVKWHHGGTFAFSIPALTFHAYSFAAALGFACTWSRGLEGRRLLQRPDMFWSFSVAAVLFVTGDILAFMSMQRLDAGTFSLLGKALSIVMTVALSRLLLQRRQSYTQYGLVLAIAAMTFVFCQVEAQARAVAGLSPGPRLASGCWPLGLLQRAASSLLTSAGAVLMERLLTREPGIPFMAQQCWMGCGAALTSLATLRLVHGLPAERLLRGFGDWRVLVLMTFYVAHGLSSGLMVKRLGAVTKALCVPVALGGCYTYAVLAGSAAFALGAFASWAGSVVLIFVLALTKVVAGKRLPK